MHSTPSTIINPQEPPNTTQVLRTDFVFSRQLRCRAAGAASKHGCCQRGISSEGVCPCRAAERGTWVVCAETSASLWIRYRNQLRSRPCDHRPNTTTRFHAVRGNDCVAFVYWRSQTDVRGARFLCLLVVDTNFALLLCCFFFAGDPRRWPALSRCHPSSGCALLRRSSWLASTRDRLS